jgi:hypothetical protein
MTAGSLHTLDAVSASGRTVSIGMRSFAQNRVSTPRRHVRM